MEVVSEGTVISGQFAGDHAVFNWTGYSPRLLDCFLPGGVTSYSGATLLTFV